MMYSTHLSVHFIHSLLHSKQNDIYRNNNYNNNNNNFRGKDLLDAVRILIKFCYKQS